MASHNSHLKLAGRIEHVLRLPDSADILMIIEDTAGGSSSPSGGGNVVPLSTPSSTMSSTRSHDLNRRAVALAKNTIMLLLRDDWALSCSFAQPGDDVEITRFVLERSGLPGLVIPDDNRRGGFGIGGNANSTSNAPALLSWASSAIKTGLPTTTLCITPSAATELIVFRKKRVAINFANVGNLAMLDVTDKEQRLMQAEHMRCESMSPPPHHDKARLGPFRSPQKGFRQQSSNGRGGNDASQPPTPPLMLTDVDGTSTGTGVAGKNCYAAVDRYYDVLFGQSASVNKHVAFLERLIGSQTRILDAGSGSGLYAFTLRSLGTTNITCLEKSLTMLRMIEEKNRFFELVESDLPERQRKGRIRAIPGDVSSFRLSAIDRSTGAEGFEDFSTVLCLSVMSHLPNLECVRRAFHCLSLHTAVGGQLIVSIPNADVVTRRGNHQDHFQFVVDRAAATLCAGATSAMPNGQVDVIVQTLVRAPHCHVSADSAAMHPTRRHPETADGIARRDVVYHGTAFHPMSATEEGLFVPFHENVTELLLPAALFEDAAISAGYDMEGLYGSLSGEPLSVSESEERVYVFRRREDQFALSDE